MRDGNILKLVILHLNKPTNKKVMKANKGYFLITINAVVYFPPYGPSPVISRVVNTPTNILSVAFKNLIPSKEVLIVYGQYYLACLKIHF